jgi:uncharacterized protein (TIGR03067 family)
MVQVAQGAQQRLLHYLLAEVSIPAHAVETKPVERFQGGRDQGLHRAGVASQRPRLPTGRKDGLQAGASFVLELLPNPAWPLRSIVLCERQLQNLRKKNTPGADSYASHQREMQAEVTPSLVPPAGVSIIRMALNPGFSARFYYNASPSDFSRNDPAPRTADLGRTIMTVQVGLLVALGLVFTADGDKEAAKKELDKFQGTWTIESLELEGKKQPEDASKGFKLVIKGDQFTSSQGDLVYKGYFKVDVGKKPKTIDITFTEGPEKGKTIVGIYELEGDTYKVCLNMNDKDRPKEFVSKEGSGHVLEVLKRQKP